MPEIWIIKEYVRRRQATNEEYISTSLIYYLCAGDEFLQGGIQLMRWWDKYHIWTEGDNNNGVE